MKHRLEAVQKVASLFAMIIIHLWSWLVELIKWIVFSIILSTYLMFAFSFSGSELSIRWFFVFFIIAFVAEAIAALVLKLEE